METIHKLKTDPEYFEEVWLGDKLFECRFNDRNFIQDEIVVLMETDAERENYTGREILASIGYVLKDFQGLKEGYVVFSLINCQNFMNEPSPITTEPNN